MQTKYILKIYLLCFNLRNFLLYKSTNKHHPLYERLTENDWFVLLGIYSEERYETLNGLVT